MRGFFGKGELVVGDWRCVQLKWAVQVAVSLARSLRLSSSLVGSLRLAAGLAGSNESGRR